MAERRGHGGIELELPRLEPAHLQRAIAAAQVAGAHLRRRGLDDVLAVLDRVVANWLRPDYHLRQLAEHALPAVTGFSVETIRHGLPLLLEPLRAATIRALCDAELGDHRVLDTEHHGRRAGGARLIAHILSGNIPGLAASPVLLSLALKSAVLVKSAAGDPVFPALLAASISEVDEALGRCVQVAHWRGGDAAVESVVFGAADVVVASGSDAAIAAIAARVPGRFIGHGHKISFAAIARERLDDDAGARDLARRLAYDVSLWDQQGCLSPQLCYIERGGGVDPGAFAALLGAALTDYARQLPPRRTSFEEQSAVQRFRQAAEWGTGNATGLLASPGSADWSISIEDGPALRPSCLHRCVRLKVVDRLDDLEPALAPHRRHLEAASLAAGVPRRACLREFLIGLGVHRVCAIGSMQRPPLTWRQSGRPRLAEWVEWATVEESDE